jgi:hypothetical protein
VGATAHELGVDESSGERANGNGVLEPGESVVINPTWHVDSAVECLAGTASGLSGPAGASYDIVSNVAGYGTLAGGSNANCLEATGRCYQISVSSPPTRPSLHWDVSFRETLNTGDTRLWSVHVGASYVDVSTNDEFYTEIEALVHHAIAEPCATGSYCPSNPLNRAQAGILLARALAGSDTNVPASGQIAGMGYNCTAGGTSLFSDVAVTDAFCRHAHFVVARGILDPCATSQFCPSSSLLRGDMAIAISRVLLGVGVAVPLSYTDPLSGRAYSCDVRTPNSHFGDLTPGDPGCPPGNYLWARSIIRGCIQTLPPLYCPSDPTLRDQAAAFVARGFGLKLYTP